MGLDAKRILLIASLTTFTGIALYLLLRQNDEDSELEQFGATATSRQSVIEMRIPRHAVGFVIGREGSNIKEIQEITNTRITFNDAGGAGDDRVCTIRGKADFAQEAERLIRKAINDQPVITTVTISVPQQACGRIIGRGGDTIREMCTISRAKITVDRDTTRSPDGMRLVTIKGTEDQVSLAKQMILEKVEEEEVMRRKIELSASSRLPRHRNKHQHDPGHSEPAQDLAEARRQETLVPTGSDGYLEVYVSAVDSPGHFWVQVKSPRAVELDKLVERMTEFYSHEANRALHKLEKVSVGDLVAAPFPHDSSWYRAEVSEISEHESDPDQSTLTVYYVDFGDSDLVKRADVAELRTDFLALSHQAVECFLAGVKPTGCQWTEKAGDCFEELTYAAQWKSIMAKVVRYQQAPSCKKIPVVELVDTSSPVDVHVNRELVKRGHAVWQDSGIPHSHSHGRQARSASRESSPAVR